MDKIKQNTVFLCRNLQAVMLACGALEALAYYSPGSSFPWALIDKSGGKERHCIDYLDALREASHWDDGSV